MGWCRIGGRWQGGYTRTECNEVGGEYSDTEPGGGSPPRGTCFVSSILTHSLGQAILDLGTTYRSQVGFRDQVLAGSSFGGRMVELYYKHNPALLSIALGNHVLLGRAIRIWMDLSNYVEAVVDAAGPGAAKGAAESPLRFTEDMYKRLCAFFDELRELSDDKELQSALYAVQSDLEDFVGLAPSAAVEKLRSKK